MNEICLSCKKHTKCGRAIHETIGCGYYVPQTNEEWLKQCTTEQLAEWIHTAIFDDNFANKMAGEAYMNMQTRGDYIEMWLKQPHIKE